VRLDTARLAAQHVDAEVARLVALGARLASAEPIEEDGWRWHVLLDLDGNEFCVLRPPPRHWRIPPAT
jgi:hypothetical protein